MTIIRPQQPKTNQTDNLYNSQGLKRTGKNTRPRQINPVAAQTDFINRRLIKESETSDGRCDPGTRWVAKLRMCVDKNNIELLKQQSRSQEASKGNKVKQNSKKVLIDALRNYDSFRKQPNEKF